MSDFKNFLKNKLKGYNILYLIRLEFESLLFYTLGFIPTKIGMILRWMLGKFFFKNSNGFQWISTNVIFEHTKKISLGNNVGIGPNAYICGVGEIDIGDNVITGPCVTITSGEHPTKGRDVPIFFRQVIPSKVIIEEDVWIGSNVSILHGVTIKKGSVVAANSLVLANMELEEYSIYAGIPAKKIGTR